MNQKSAIQRIFPRRLDIQNWLNYSRSVKKQPKFPINLQVLNLVNHYENMWEFRAQIPNNQKAWNKIIRKVRYVWKVQLGERWIGVIDHYKSCHRVHSLRLKWNFQYLPPIKTKSGMLLNTFQNLTELILEDFNIGGRLLITTMKRSINFRS